MQRPPGSANPPSARESGAARPLCSDPKARHPCERDKPYLDANLAFLAAQGVPPGPLLAALGRAEREQVSFPQALMAGEEVSEDSFYRHLARHLGLRYVDTALDISVRNLESALIAGLVPLAGSERLTSWLIAPPPERLAKLLAEHRRHALPRERMFLTSPRRYRRLVFEALREQVAERGSGALSRFEPGLSARASSRRSALMLVGVIAVMAAACCAPGSSSLFGSLLFAPLIAFKLYAAAASCERERESPPALPDALLPVYTILVPLYREAHMASSLLAALAAIDYPRAKLDVKLVIESDDSEMRAALASLRLPYWVETVVAPHGVPRTKPRALNIALPLARGSLLAVYDAEDEPDPGQLRAAAERFAVEPPTLACLQASLAIDNMADTQLAALFGVEYAALFDVQLRGLAALDMPIPLGGTSNHFRVSALRRVCAWDAWNVTEDMDLGLRLARFGYSVKTLASTTYEEAPATIDAWLKQRRRWMKGWMQTLLTHCREPSRIFREIGPLRALAVFSLIASPLAGFLMAPLVAVHLGYDLFNNADFLHPQNLTQLTESTSAGFILVGGAVALLWPILLGMRRRGLFAFSSCLLWLPLYLTLLSWAAWRALFDLLDDPYHWAKTEHGLARSSRRKITVSDAPQTPPDRTLA